MAAAAQQQTAGMEQIGQAMGSIQQATTAAIGPLLAATGILAVVAMQAPISTSAAASARWRSAHKQSASARKKSSSTQHKRLRAPAYNEQTCYKPLTPAILT